MRFFITFLIIAVFLNHNTATAQAKADTEEAVYYKIITADEIIFIGKLLKNDPKEVVLLTENVGEVSIPKYQITSMEEMGKKQQSKLKNKEAFDGLYVYTNSAHSIPKGEVVAVWRLIGPAVNFGITDNFTLGVTSSWLGAPLLANVKYTFELASKVRAGVGGSFGTVSWINPSTFIGLPFANVTVGDGKRNVTLLVGRAFFKDSEDGFQFNYFNLAGMIKGQGTVSFVMDSFILLDPFTSSAVGLVIPGMRFQTKPYKAFQFGLGGAFSTLDNSTAGGAINAQWFRKF